MDDGFTGSCDEFETAIDNSIGYQIKITDQVIRRQMISEASSAGIDSVTVMHGWIINYLHSRREDDVFQRDIERSFSIGRSTVTNILKLMEKKGYINRESIQSDARLKKISLTDEGEKVYAAIHNTIDTNDEKMMNVLTEDERQTFLRLIKKLRRGIENL